LEGKGTWRDTEQRATIFGFSVINHQSPKVPTILRSYWKINAGPFVECEGGVRLLRIPEIERLMGFAPKKGFTSHSYSTAVEILGQGCKPGFSAS